jgi:hypothetical protein
MAKGTVGYQTSYSMNVTHPDFLRYFDGQNEQFLAEDIILAFDLKSRLGALTGREISIGTPSAEYRHYLALEAGPSFPSNTMS